MRTLKEEVERYGKLVAEYVEKGGQVPATFFIVDQEGKVHPLVFEYEGNETKTAATEIVRQYAAEVDAAQIVYVSEAWVTSHESSADLDSAPLPSEDPRREEVIILSGEDRTGAQLSGWRKITRGEGGSAKVGPLEWMDHALSRFLGLLPGTVKQ